MNRNQIINVDYMCNECGNCRTFCPYDSAPYLEKFTLFADEEAMESSKNRGFAVVGRTQGTCRIRLENEIIEYISGEESDDVPENIRNLIAAVIAEYKYLL